MQDTTLAAESCSSEHWSGTGSLMIDMIVGPWMSLVPLKQELSCSMLIRSMFIHCPSQKIHGIPSKKP
jgi:hypothetical protein